MLRLAHVTLANPRAPRAGTIRVLATVVEDAFGLAIGPAIVQRLRLGGAVDRPVHEVLAASPLMLPEVGPVRVGVDAIEVTTSAIVAGAGVIVGAALARELGLDEKTALDAEAERVLVRPDAVAADVVARVREHVARHRAEAMPALIGDAGGKRLDRDVRDTSIVPTRGVEPLLDAILRDAIHQHLEPTFDFEAAWFERPKLLHYGEGGRYEVHADADQRVPSAGGGGWQRTQDRDISVLVYLNEGFDGGRLRFPRHDVAIRPRAGMLVAFPSDGRYLHAAEPVTRGERMVLVSWVAARGSRRVAPPPLGATLL